MGRLCITCGDNDQWLPVPVNTIRSFLNNLIREYSGVKYTYELRSNLAYNIQYLQFLEYSTKDLRLTSVLWTQTVKSFIVTGIGIVEAILYYVIRSNNLHRENRWALMRNVTTNQFKINNDNCKIENHFYIQLDEPIEEEMTLDSMLKKVEKRKLLGEETEIYKKLNYLRKLRNRVHLHLVEETLKTDWHAFNRHEFDLTKEVLLTLFCSSLFNPAEKDLNWLSFLSVEQK